LPLSQQGVYLTDKLEGGVLFVKDHGVNGIQHDWDLPSVEEELELLPVVLLLAIALGVGERVHGDVRREVAREDFSHQETVVEGTSHVLD